jgi:murein DD-endopeptidase MepM/ murein hydrolase activator NlpD
MSLLRVTAWTLLGCAAAFIAFLIATVRVVEPQPEAPAAPPAAASAPAARPALVVPVAGVDRSQLRRDWGDARGGGARMHQGLDIIAPGGTPVLAAADGTVEKLFYSNGGGGITLYQRSSDGRWTYYYAHLAGYAANIAERQRLRAGQTIGYVGDTGNAGAGNTHLHFGIAAMAPGERWWQGTPVDPYPLLAGARAAR